MLPSSTESTIFCSNCLTPITGNRYRECTLCQLVFYCNILCKVKHKVVHEPTCSEIQRCRREHEAALAFSGFPYPSVSFIIQKELALSHSLLACGRKDHSQLALTEGAHHHIAAMTYALGDQERLSFCSNMLLKSIFLCFELGILKRSYFILSRFFGEHFLTSDDVTDEDVYADLKQYRYRSCPSGLTLMKLEAVSLMMVFKINLYLYEAQKIKIGDSMRSWYSFLLGCHPRLGQHSYVYKISRCYPALKHICQYAVPLGMLPKLKKQCLRLMTMVNEENELVIDALIDPDSHHTHTLDSNEDETELVQTAQRIASAGHHALGKRGIAFLRKNKLRLL